MKVVKHMKLEQKISPNDFTCKPSINPTKTSASKYIAMRVEFNQEISKSDLLNARKKESISTKELGYEEDSNLYINPDLTKFYQEILRGGSNNWRLDACGESNKKKWDILRGMTGQGQFTCDKLIDNDSVVTEPK
ncbi:hypothetical protein HHI36_013559 [Cryptolaemus montrouzieri]|uniref:Uncharacterized protein n=1 Tax=Cryptolaemus montrouzieri TaxID=559131 RepID=A0ABD2NHL0_9CUCU